MRPFPERSKPTATSWSWLLAIAVALLFPGAAIAAVHPGGTPQHALPGVVVSYSTYSDRYLVYSIAGAGARRISILDTKRVTHREITLPEGCVTWAEASVGGGRSLFPCADRDLLMDLGTGRFTSFERPDKYSRWDMVGRHWIGAGSACPPPNNATDACTLYRNLDTGETRAIVSGYRDPEYDLDSPDLTTVTICAPLGPSADGRWPFNAFGPYVLLSREPMTVGHCGSQHRRAIGGRFATTLHGALTGGWVSFLKNTLTSFNQPPVCPRVAYAYRLTTQRTVAWKTPNVHGARCIQDVIHTKYAIVTALLDHTRQVDSLEDYYYRLVVARLPSGSPSTQRAIEPSKRSYLDSWAILPVGKHWMRIEIDATSSYTRFGVELRPDAKGGGVAATYAEQPDHGNTILDDLVPTCLVTRLPNGVRASKLRPRHQPSPDATDRRSFAKKWLARMKKSECIEVRSTR